MFLLLEHLAAAWEIESSFSLAGALVSVDLQKYQSCSDLARKKWPEMTDADGFMLVVSCSPPLNVYLPKYVNKIGIFFSHTYAGDFLHPWALPYGGNKETERDEINVLPFFLSYIPS